MSLFQPLPDGSHQLRQEILLLFFYLIQLPYLFMRFMRILFLHKLIEYRFPFFVFRCKTILSNMRHAYCDAKLRNGSVIHKPRKYILIGNSD